MTPAERNPAMGRKDPYETKTVRRAKDVRKLVAQGWEVVSTSGKENWFWGSDFQAVLRRPNPKYRG